jgi:hypothetical protein
MEILEIKKIPRKKTEKNIKRQIITNVSNYFHLYFFLPVIITGFPNISKMEKNGDKF